MLILKPWICHIKTFNMSLNFIVLFLATEFLRFRTARCHYGQNYTTYNIANLLTWKTFQHMNKVQLRESNFIVAMTPSSSCALSGTERLVGPILRLIIPGPQKIDLGVFGTPEKVWGLQKILFTPPALCPSLSFFLSPRSSSPTARARTHTHTHTHMLFLFLSSGTHWKIPVERDPNKTSKIFCHTSSQVSANQATVRSDAAFDTKMNRLTTWPQTHRILDNQRGCDDSNFRLQNTKFETTCLK